MLSDAALALAIDCDAKWLYNAARRLKRPIRRGFEDATWWRLTHHLSGRLGIQVSDAARAADLLLAPGTDLGRVRLRATSDDSVAISVDLGRFHDGAALALAAALHLAKPRRRGRPPKATPPHGYVLPDPDAQPSADNASRLATAFAGIRAADGGSLADATNLILSALAEASVPFVLTGDVAAAYHGGRTRILSLDLAADFGPHAARLIAKALNGIHAIPRGVSVREGFALDSALVRSAPCLALRANGVPLNITRDVPGLGEFPQVREASELVPMEGSAYRVMSRTGLSRTTPALAAETGAG